MHQELRENAQRSAQKVSLEAHQEEQIEEARSLILRELTCKIDGVPTTTKAQLEQLDLNALEDLGEALLGFVTLEDLNDWLGRSPQ